MIFSIRVMPFPIKRETKYFRLSKIVFLPSAISLCCHLLIPVPLPCPYLLAMLGLEPRSRGMAKCWHFKQKRFTKNKINKEKNKNLVALKTSLFSIFQSF